MKNIVENQCIKTDKPLPMSYEALKAERDALADRVNALAVENAAMKKFCKNAAFDADYESELCMERGGFTDALNNIETPATDAALAAIEARSITAALDSCSEYLDTDCVMDRLGISYGDAELRSIGAMELCNALKSHAANIREAK